MNPLLEVRDLSRHFVVKKYLFSRNRVIQAVRGARFSVYPGEVLGLVGESGSGKSTTAAMILRLIEPIEGTILFRGIPIAGLTDREMRRLRKDLQIIFQYGNSVLDPLMTVEELLIEPLRIHAVVPGDEIDVEVDRILALVGLSSADRRRYPGRLSGGQYQRIIIARAIAVRPALVVCDEPVSALDVSVQGQILNLLIRLREQLGLTYLFISHDLKVIRHVCDRIAVMYRGEIVEIGPRDQVLGSPSHEYTARLVAGLSEQP
jgi:peptide/nickel transport system ATP-binding protein/oligopeptide transport system ATP-binding protein